MPAHKPQPPGCRLDVSVIVCTYNRSHLLRNSLERFCEIFTETLSWELIVVDNNSTDETPSVVSHYTDNTNLPVQYLFEPEQGLSHARSTGIRYARGQVVAFTDDDVLVDRDWVLEIRRAHNQYHAACFGGPIYPLWDAPPPRWLTEELNSNLALLNYGDEDHVLDPPRLWGANMAFTREVFDQYGTFDTALGRTAGKLYGGEDIEYIGKLHNGGEKVMYCAKMRVGHHISNDRMKKSYFRKWRFDQGELRSRQFGKQATRTLFGAPLFAWRALLKKVTIWIIRSSLLRKNSFAAQLEAIELIGFINGCRQLDRINATPESHE